MKTHELLTAGNVERPSYYERGFRFRVPRGLRKTVGQEMRNIGQKNGFEVDHVGFFGTIRCTYRERNTDTVMAFIAAEMRDRKVTLIPDYQARYGVLED